MYRMQESAHPGNLRLALKAAVIMAAVFIVDQYSKASAFGSERLSQMNVIPKLFGFMHHRNFGIVANVPVPRWVIIMTTCLIIGLIISLLRRSIRSGVLLHVVGYALVLAGAVGNLYDRIAFGYVRDWILLFDLSIINIADIAICVGILMLLGRGRGIRD